MVLKDYWIPEHSKTEGQIQAEIFKYARKELDGERDSECFKKYFMTIHHDTVVDISGNPDTSKLCIRERPNPRKHGERLLELASDAKATPAQILGSCNTKPTGGNPIPLPTPDKHDTPQDAPQLFEHRKHCRLVFQEVGKPLHQINDLKVIFQCLHDALQGTFRWMLRYFPLSFTIHQA